MKKIDITLFLGLIFASCNPESKFATEIKTITNFNKTVDSLETVFNSINVDSVKYIQTTASEYEKMIKMHYITDTIDQEFAQKMNDIKAVRKGLSSFDRDQKLIVSEIDALRLQYKNLDSDIKNGILNSNQVKTYMAEEEKALYNLGQNVNTVYENQKRQFVNFYYSNELVATMVKQLKLKQD